MQVLYNSAQEVGGTARIHAFIQEHPVTPPRNGLTSVPSIPLMGMMGHLSDDKTQYHCLSARVADSHPVKPVCTTGPRRLSHTSMRITPRNQGFVDWLDDRTPLLRVDPLEGFLSWDFPLAKSEKRELLCLGLVAEGDEYGGIMQQSVDKCRATYMPLMTPRVV